MDVTCSSETCDIILSSKCVIYQGTALSYLNIPTNTNLQTALQSIDAAVQDILAGASAVWGSITGDITNQTDLIAYLDANYAPISAGGYWPLGGQASLSDDVYIMDAGGKSINFGFLFDPIAGFHTYADSVSIRGASYSVIAENGGDNASISVSTSGIGSVVVSASDTLALQTGSISLDLRPNELRITAPTVWTNSSLNFVTDTANLYDLWFGMGDGEDTHNFRSFRVAANSNSINFGNGYGALDYGSDMSATYTDRSMIDKGYADTSYWKTTGTTELDGNIIITGGAVSRNILMRNVDGSANRASFSLTSSQLAIQWINNEGRLNKMRTSPTDVIMGYYKTGASLVEKSITFNDASMTIVDGDLKGLYYAADYSSSASARWLADKQYVDSTAFTGGGIRTMEGDLYVQGDSSSYEIYLGTLSDPLNAFKVYANSFEVVSNGIPKFGGTSAYFQYVAGGLELVGKKAFYSADYSSTFNDRSLADWGNVWKVKGDTTTIGNLNIGPANTSDSYIYLKSNPAGASQSYTYISNSITSNVPSVSIGWIKDNVASEFTSLTFSDNSVVFSDQRTIQTGIEYAADYSATFTDLSLVNKAWVLAQIGGGGGITNSAVANELMKSDGANAVASGIFVTTAGSVDLGTGLAGSSRSVTATGSATNISVSLIPKGISSSILYDSAQSNFWAVSSTDISGRSTGSFYLEGSSTVTNSVNRVLRLVNNTSAVPAAGIGTGMSFESETAAGNNEIGAIIEAVTTDVTPTSEDFDLVFKTMYAGAAANTKFTIKAHGAVTFQGSFTATGLGHGVNISHVVNGGTAPTYAALNYNNSFTFGNNSQAYYSAFINPTITAGAFTGTTTIGIYYFASGTLTANHYGLIIANGNTGLGHTTPDRKLAVAETDTSVSAVTYVQKLSHLISSGTQAAGLGVGLEFELNTSGNSTSGTRKVGATIEAIATNVTVASEAIDMIFKTVSGGGTVSEKLRITSDGRLYGTALHNNAGAVTGATNQYIASGTYNPTCTTVANLDSTPSATNFQWSRIGNVVTVSGMMVADPTAASTVTTFRISLPIASDFFASENCGGTATYISTVGGTAVGAAIIRADGTNNEAFVQLYPSGTSQITLTVIFQYVVV